MRARRRPSARACAAGWLAVLAGLLAVATPSQAAPPFLWGTGSSAYQVEGAPRADGKGRSVWDVYTEDEAVTVPFIGRKETGAVAIGAYDRGRMQSDIALMRQLGVNAYRFSIAWSRVLPGGVGTPNAAALAHYGQLIDDLKAAGIEPVVTLYHWDLPQALAARGGWDNPQSVGWFAAYAEAVFRAFGDRVPVWITINEPFANLFEIEPEVQRARAHAADPHKLDEADYARAARQAHHWLMASAAAIGAYRRLGLTGMIGPTLNLTAALPVDPVRKEDRDATARFDAIQNRWFLDAIYKGRYPDEILALYRARNPDLAPTDADMRLIAGNRPDFLGVNFYGASYVKGDPGALFGADNAYNPDPVKMANGPVRPECLQALLLRLTNDYGRPPIVITENGADFGPRDETPVAGIVEDPLRSKYFRDHVAAALNARAAGADLRGYFAWSFADNFEWTSGYTRRFGLVHVDFATLQRTPKRSFWEYRALIAAHSQGAGAVTWPSRSPL